MYQVLNLSLVSYAAQVCVYKLLYVFEIVAAEKDEKIKKKVPQLIHTYMRFLLLQDDCLSTPFWTDQEPKICQSFNHN